MPVTVGRVMMLAYLPLNCELILRSIYSILFCGKKLLLSTYLLKWVYKRGPSILKKVLTKLDHW